MNNVNKSESGKVESFMRLILDAEDQTKVSTLARKAVVRLGDIDTPALSIVSTAHKGTVVTNRVHDWKMTLTEVELAQLNKTMHHHPSL